MAATPNTLITKMTAKEIAETNPLLIIDEFIQDAKQDEGYTPQGWGEPITTGAEYFDMAFNVAFSLPAYKALKAKGIYRIEVTEIADEDHCDSITLIADDKNGHERFRQQIVFS